MGRERDARVVIMVDYFASPVNRDSAYSPPCRPLLTEVSARR